MLYIPRQRRFLSRQIWWLCVFGFCLNWSSAEIWIISNLIKFIIRYIKKLWYGYSILALKRWFSYLNLIAKNTTQQRLLNLSKKIKTNSVKAAKWSCRLQAVRCYCSTQVVQGDSPDRALQRCWQQNTNLNLCYHYRD